MKNGVFWDVTPWGSCNIPEEAILQNPNNSGYFKIKMDTDLCGSKGYYIL
jgi:hypothetical protein